MVMEKQTLTQQLNERLRLNQSYDLIGKQIVMGGKSATLYFIDGFAKDEVMEKVLEFFIKMKPEDWQKAPSPIEFCKYFAPYLEASPESNINKLITSILSGTLALVIDGYPAAICLDARTYPTRGVKEPEDDRVLRGSRDGFVETIVHNTALIRRRIRDPRLTMEITRAGRRSHTDIVLSYIDGLADEKMLANLRKRIQEIDINTLTMSQESLAECLIPRQWYNPYPKVRYTERPDTAAACIAEGQIILIVDNSPAVMILPSSLFSFVQDTNDYYFPPLVGTYLRLVRCFVFLLTLFLTPTWYLFMRNPHWIPSWLSFIGIAEANTVPILLQLLIVEFIIDGLKLASLNTPNALANSFSVVGALILGDFAVSAGWFVPEVVLYMAFVAIANFAQPSYELGYAFKLSRIFLLALTGLFNAWGFGLGLILLLTLISTTRTVTGKNYLYPLFPFNGTALKRLIIRMPIHRSNS